MGIRPDFTGSKRPLQISYITNREHTPVNKTSKRTLLPLFFILIVAIIVRLIGLGSEYLWYDEGCSYGLAECSLRTMFSYIKQDVHPPLFYVLLHYYVKVLPNPGLFTIRLFPMVIDLMALLMLFQFTRVFVNDRTALVASLIYRNRHGF